MEDKVKQGYWSIATQKHLKKFTQDSSNLDEFDTLNVAGKAGRFIGMIRGNTLISNIRKLEKMAGSIGIGRSELYRTIIPNLESASNKKIEIKKNTVGDIIGIEEYLFSNDEVLEVTGEFFSSLNPRSVERIAIESLDETKKLPLLEDELMGCLFNAGFNEGDITLSCALQQQFKLVQKLSKGRDAIYSNEYVWGPNHHKIAYAVGQLDLGDKDEIRAVIDLIQQTQGYPIEKLPIMNNELLLLSKKTGIINPTIISTNRNVRKEFGFSSNLIDNGLYNDDILDDVKILLASIRFGEHYTNHTTLHNVEDFLKALINREKVGPHSANGTDYILLEKRGIVKVELAYGDRYYMSLLKKDVGRAALDIVSNANYDIHQEVAPVNVDSMMQYGDFLSAEELRIDLVESPESVVEAEDYLARVLRNENI